MKNHGNRTRANVKSNDQPTVAVAAEFEWLMDSLRSRSYSSFVGHGDAHFKAAITPQIVEGVSEQIAPRMKAGYSAVYLCQMVRSTYTTHLWKLGFRDKQGDRLARLTLRKGKVNAFYIW